MSDTGRVPEDTKPCSRCSRVLPRSDFYRQSASKDGLQAWCRECVRDRKREERRRLRAPRPETAADEKWCRECREVKALTEFSPHRLTSDGRQSYCKACFAKRYRRLREESGKRSRPASIPEGHKYCRSCDQVLPLAEWPRRQISTDGYHSKCKACAAVASRADHLARTYGMTVEDVESMFTKQGGLCAICRISPAVQVDHDHATGEVRGMLCFSCNAALGHLRDDPAVLRRAARYLDTYVTKTLTVPATSRRDEVAWEVVLSPHTSGDSSLLEQLFAARLAEHSGGPAS